MPRCASFSVQYNLCCMALDAFATDQMVPVPHEIAAPITETEKLRDELFEYLETDTVWCVARCAVPPLPNSCIRLLHCVDGETAATV